MVDTKKEQEREELHRAIWAIADELRGAVRLRLATMISILPRCRMKKQRKHARDW